MDDIRTFDRIARSSSLSEAARGLKLSTAAVSRRLEALEARLGVRLVTRTSRLVRLTRQGRDYHSHCRRILVDLDQAEQVLSQGQTTESGLLRIAAPVSFGRRRVAPALSAFSRRHPGLSLQLVLNDAADALSSEEFDAVIQVGRPDAADFVARRIVEARRVVCAAPAYLDRAGRPEKPADLTGHTTLALERGGRLLDRWAFQGASGIQRVIVSPTMVSNSGEVLQAWLLDGLGIGLKSVWDVAADLAAGRLIDLFADSCLERADLYVVYADRRYLPLRTRLLIDFLAEELAGQQDPAAEADRRIRAARPTRA